MYHKATATENFEATGTESFKATATENQRARGGGWALMGRRNGNTTTTKRRKGYEFGCVAFGTRRRLGKPCMNSSRPLEPRLGEQTSNQTGADLVLYQGFRGRAEFDWEEVDVDVSLLPGRSVTSPPDGHERRYLNPRIRRQRLLRRQRRTA